jgi:hypothetical protein
LYQSSFAEVRGKNCPCSPEKVPDSRFWHPFRMNRIQGDQCVARTLFVVEQLKPQIDTDEHRFTVDFYLCEFVFICGCLPKFRSEA